MAPVKQCLDIISKDFCLYIDLTTWPNLTKFCSLTLAGASPPHPLMNAWLPKNSNLTQAKIFLLRKNISFGLGLNFWLVRPSGNAVFKKKTLPVKSTKAIRSYFSDQSRTRIFSSTWLWSEWSHLKFSYFCLMPL